MTNLIALCGQKGSGKSTCGEFLDSAGYTQVSFAKKLKDLVSTIYNLDRKKLEGLTEEDRQWRETKLPTLFCSKGHQIVWEKRSSVIQSLRLVYGIQLTDDYTQTFDRLPGMTALDIYGSVRVLVAEHLYGKQHSPRELLQIIGTEVFRSIHPDTWCIALGRDIKPSLDTGARFVITDCRFENEVAWVKRMGGKVVYIERPGLSAEDSHASEQTDSIKPLADYVITNSSTLEELQEQVLKAVGISPVAV